MVTLYYHILSLLFSTAVIIFFFFLFYSRSHLHRSSKTPCPDSYPLIGNLIAFLHNRHRFHDWVTEMLSHTPSNTLQVRGFLGIHRGICTSNPTNVEHLLRTNFSNYIKGSRFHNVLFELLGDGIFNVDGDLWAFQRKIASHEFKTRSLRTFIEHIVHSEISNRLIPYLNAASESRVTLDLQEVFRKFAFDNICNLAFGFYPSESEISFVPAFDEAVEISLSRFMSPMPWIWKLKRFLNIGSEKRLREAIKVVDEFAMNIIKSKERERAESDQDSNHDLLSRFMSSPDLKFRDEDEKRRFLRDIVISFVLAGKDTTSTALTWFFWLISANPRCERLIYEELSTAFATSPAKMFQYEELKQLQYLHAAISESLRLFPQVPINSRLTVVDDVLPDGTFVGAGWFADYSAFAMGRMEKVWGPNCGEFLPERWLDKDGVFVPSDQYRFPVFHCGPRMCLGKEMAYVQMKSIAAAMIYGFEIEVFGSGGKTVRPNYTLSLLLKMEGGLLVRLKRRSQTGTLTARVG